ncbi:MAG: VCBS repeat-containing protein [Planctomycetes bacterium]|nr:VCBS repeat-containing protein [Planctomycetota bacterium]
MTTNRESPASDDTLDPRLETIVESMLERLRRGETPSIAEYAAAYPDLAAKIERLFPKILLLEKMQSENTNTSESTTPPGIASPISAKESALSRIGEFRIAREIGRGGMGIVYAAEQESLKRGVALKVLSSRFRIDKRLEERFQREAQIAAKLQHPNIIPIYGFGEEDGIYYYAMQLVKGEGLDKVLQEISNLCSREYSQASKDFGAGRTREDGGSSATSSMALGLLNGRFDEEAIEKAATGINQREGEQPPAELTPQYFNGIARIGFQVADALAYAHKNGVLHRDIKPSNLILDYRGTVWVADFGLAKLSGLDDLTHSDEVLGTLRYMAPEQFRGAPGEASDIYSLGVTLYELLALEPAFTAGNRGELVRKILEEEPPSLGQLNPRVPAELAAIVSKAIAKIPAERYSKAVDLAADLKDFTGGLPVQVEVRKISAPKKAAARRLRLALAGAILAVAIAAVWFAVRPGFKTAAVTESKPSTSRLQVVELPGDIKADRYPVGRGPKFVKAADFDGDGRLDLAMANGVSNDVSVLLNAGGGKFSAASQFAAGNLPAGFAAADFDGDGRLDLAVSNRDSKNILLLANPGNGAFEKAGAVDFDEPLLVLASGDWNRDGASDLAVAAGSRHVWVLMNRGRWNFEKLQKLEVGSGPYGVFISDWNGDMAPDLAVTYKSSEHLGILWNLGGGSFSKLEQIFVGGSGFAVVTADLNGDGLADLAGSSMDKDASGNLTVKYSFWILKNTGGGKFGPVETVNTEGAVQALAAGDLNGDGAIDLVAAGGSANVLALKNDGRGRFLAAVALPDIERPNSIEIGDFNGDKRPDLAITQFNSGSVAVIINTGDIFR